MSSSIVLIRIAQSLSDSSRLTALQPLGLDLSGADPSNPLVVVRKSLLDVQLEAVKKFNDFHFLLAREIVRNFFLAAVYAASYYGLARI